MAWLLDTNVWIMVLKDDQSRIGERLAAVDTIEICVCSVVKAELIHGAMGYGNPSRRRNVINEAVAPFVSHPFDDEAARQYGRIRHGLEKRGLVIGSNDLMIAAICLAHDCTLVTSNLAEFSRVPGLKCEDWSQP